MGSLIESVKTSLHSVGPNKGYIPCAVEAGKKCFKEKLREERQVGMLINTGIYKEKHIVEPALSTLILGKIIHKSFFSNNNPADRLQNILAFDLNNGACGLIQAIQIIDGYIQSGKIECGMVVAGDSLPMVGKTNNYSFSQGAAAILLSGGKNNKGFIKFKTETYPQYKDEFSSHSFFSDNVLSLNIKEAKTYLDNAVNCAVISLENFFKETDINLEDIDLITGSQLPAGFMIEVGKRLNVQKKIVQIKEHESGFHTAAPLISLHSIFDTTHFKKAKNVLFLAVGSGINTSIALYRQ